MGHSPSSPRPLRTGMSGWYAELPTPLIAQFNRLYPGKGVKQRLTNILVRRAIIDKGEQPVDESQDNPQQLTLPLEIPNETLRTEEKA